MTPTECIYQVSNWYLKACWTEVRKTRTDGRTSLSMNKPTTWCKSGRVSLVSSSCLYKTQPERVLAQLCHTRIDALSLDEYQFHCFYFTEILIILKQHIPSDWITNEPRKPWGDFLEPSACMDTPSSDGLLSVWTNPQHDASLDGYTDGRTLPRHNTSIFQTGV